MYRPLRIVLFVHGVITLAGAIVLALFPTAIPSMVGIAVARPQYLLVYLIGAAELAVAVLSFGATRLTDAAALRLVMMTFIVLHGASGVLDLVYLALTDVSTAIVANTVARFVVVAVFVWLWRTTTVHHTPGTNR